MRDRRREPRDGDGGQRCECDLYIHALVYMYVDK